MNVVTKQGKQGVVSINKDNHSAVIAIDGINYTVAFVRDQKKIVIKNDMLLNQIDLEVVKQELAKFIKKQDDGKKRRK